MRITQNYPLDDPARPVHAALVSYEGTTSANGNAGGTTIVDDDLANEPSYAGSFFTIKMLSGDAAGQVIPIITHPAGTNTVTVGTAFRDNAGAIVQIVAGTRFCISSSGMEGVLTVLGTLADTLDDTAGVATAMSLLRFILEGGKGTDAIFDLVNAILTLMETGGSLTTDGNVQDLYRVETPLGVFQPKLVQLDTTLMQAAETIDVEVSYRIVDGGGFILADTTTFAGVQAVPLKIIELQPNRFGVQVTIQRTAGVDRAYPWAVFYRG